MWWENIDWAVVLAAFAGPIVAVCITLWYQGNYAARQARRDIYIALMRTRRYPISGDFVGAFNLVPVHFYGYKDVMERYRQLIGLFSDTAWHNPETSPRVAEKIPSAIAHLLSAMSVAVKTPISQLDILDGAYAPQGWADDEQAQRELRDAMRLLLSGEKPLPVTLLSSHGPQDERLQSKNGSKPEVD